MVIQAWTLACLIIAGGCVKQATVGQKRRTAEVTLGANGLLHSWSGQNGTAREAPHHWPTVHSLVRHVRSNGFQNSWALLSATHGRDDPNTAPTAAENVSKNFYISCGGHRAKLCSLCTVQDAEGIPTFDHGSDWCNGDCYWGDDAKCHLKTKAHIDGIVSLPAAQNESQHTTSPVPEMDSNFSQHEKEDIHLAADRALEESTFEAKMAYAKAKEEKEENSPSKKFWFVVIITASVCLVCCACPALILLVVFMAFPDALKTKKAGEDSEADSSAVEEDAGDEQELDDGAGYAA